MNPDYNTLLRFYKAATEGYQNGYMSNNIATPTMPQAQPNPQQNVLPPQTVIQVNGKSSVDSMRMSPNSSVLLMDTTAPIVWLCTSDGLGNVTSVPYDISQHKDTPPVDVDNLENRVTNLETLLTNLIGGARHDKSDDKSDESGEDSGTVG